MNVFGRKLRHLCASRIHFFAARRRISGVLCDIDGVLLRGREVLTGAREAIEALYHRNIPVLFVTNQGLQIEEEKAFALSQTLGLKVKPEQVVLSHTPLRHCSLLHDKFVLVIGQRNIKETASSVGFKNICEIEDIQRAYPLLDMIDKENRLKYVHSHKPIPRIEGILLLGEPVKWESPLQLVIDLLLSDGCPSIRPQFISEQHIPIVACNTDLLWMAEAPIPRFGHGTFLLCLEALYKKITGSELQYTIVTGKPFLDTFQYAEKIMKKYLRNKNHVEPLDRVYIIGDNPDTDIYGGNLYRQHLRQSNPGRTNNPGSTLDVSTILVCTGVHAEQDHSNNSHNKPIYVHKDIKFQRELTNPDSMVDNIEQAVQLILNNNIT